MKYNPQSFCKVLPFIFAGLFLIFPIDVLAETGNSTPVFNMTIAYLITAMISFILLLSYVAFVKKREILFVFLYSAVFLVNVGYAFASASTSVAESLLANRISYLGAVFLPLFMLLIIAEECSIQFPKWLNTLLIVVCSSIFFLSASAGYSTLYYRGVELVVTDHGSYLVKDYGPLHLLYYIYLALYFVFSVVTILYSYYTKKNKSIRLTLHLLACLSCNIVVWYLRQVFHFEFEFLAISYIVTETYLLSLYNMMEVFYEKEHALIEQSMVTMIVDPTLDETEIDYETDLSIDIEEIIRIWPQVAQLTPREIEVFQLLIQNRKRKDIAEELCVSENTVKKHTSNIFSKLNITNRTEIIKTISKVK